MGLQMENIEAFLRKRVDIFRISVIFIDICGAVMVSIEFFDCRVHVEDNHLASLKSVIKL